MVNIKIRGFVIMKVRFGYVAIAMRLDKVTSSSPVTYKKYSSLDSERERLSYLKK